MIVRTLYERQPFVDNDDGTRTSIESRRWWWSISWLQPGHGGAGVWLLPSIEWERTSQETDIEVHWLLWGVAVWWQTR